MADQVSSWRDVVTDRPDADAVVLVCIHRCRLIDGAWCRVERFHLPHGFDSMPLATELAEARNRQRWPSFDWLKDPTEAFLAFRD